MTDLEQIELMRAALEKIAAAATEKPYWIDSDEGPEYYGNEDDARASGVREGEWYAAETAREVLAKLPSRK